MKSSQKNEWIVTMKIEIHDIKKKIYNLMKWSDKKKSKFSAENKFIWSKSIKTMRFWNIRFVESFRISVNKKKLTTIKFICQ